MEYLTVLFWSSVGSLFSLIGGIVLVKNAQLRAVAIRYGLPFGAGALLAAALVGLLPEAVEMSSAYSAGMAMLVGFLAFFLLERTLSWFHHHAHHHRGKVHESHDTTHKWLVVIGDTAHNAIDGVAIGAAFLVSPTAGVGTAIAVAAHEIPQEIGDFGILLGKGMRPRRVILVNVLSALATVVTALTTFALGSGYDINPALMLAAAAGFFIYIAASDIIPGIHHQPRREGNRQAVMLFVGVLVVTSVIALAPHSHEADHDHSHDHDHDHHVHDDHHD